MSLSSCRFSVSLIILMIMEAMKCTLLLNAYPYLLEEEETYEPPQDPDSGKSAFFLAWRVF